MRFVDLFAGLGGFNLALGNLGHRCVFASEIEKTLRHLYERNFGMPAMGDLREIDAADIPPHDILCAGFPCQPFSKAGSQPGLKDPNLGDLYTQILRVIHYQRPRYLILENVPNLEYHSDGRTWEKIKALLEAEGYNVEVERLSPHHYGVPQIRERIYIVGSIDPLNGFKWPERKSTHKDVSIRSVLLKNPPDARPIPDKVRDCLAIWQEFLDRVPKRDKIPHPLWSMEFGATYPFKRTTPSAMTTDRLRRYRGSHGRRLSQTKDRKAVFQMLPSHARTKQNHFPTWKIRFIQRNREFYQRHSDWLDDWMEKIGEFPSSFQKLEWNCQERDPRDEDRRLRRYVIQIRPSGVRVKRPTTAPSLVAMTATQVPIITWEGRYMTPSECKRLQSMDDLRFLPDSAAKAYEALGNAVNVHVAQLVAEALVGCASKEELAEQPIAAPQPLPPAKRGGSSAYSRVSL